MIFPPSSFKYSHSVGVDLDNGPISSHRATIDGLADKRQREIFNFLQSFSTSRIYTSIRAEPQWTRLLLLCCGPIDHTTNYCRTNSKESYTSGFSGDCFISFTSGYPRLRTDVAFYLAFLLLRGLNPYGRHSPARRALSKKGAT